MEKQEVITKLQQRVQLPALEEPETAPVADISRYKRADEVGTSFLQKDQLSAAPIPTNPIAQGELRELTEEQLAELRRRPLSDEVRDAISRLGGVDYLIRVGQYDHRTLLGLAGKLAPREVQLGPSDSLYDLVKASMLVTVEGEVLHG